MTLAAGEQICRFSEKALVGDGKLTDSDYDSLSGSNWVSTKVIDAYLELLCKDVDSANFIPSHLYGRVKERDQKALEGCVKLKLNDLLLVPVQVISHWILVVVHDSANEQILTLYDPMYGERFKDVLEGIKAILEDKKKLMKVQIAKNTPKSSRSEDCGVFLCVIAKYVTLNLPFNWTEDHVSALRVLIKKELKWHKVQQGLYQPQMQSQESTTKQSSRRSLSTKRPLSANSIFSNKSSDICWLNSTVQLILAALSAKDQPNLTSTLGRQLNKFLTERCPKRGFDCSRIRELLSTHPFESLLHGQQCVVEGLDAIHQNPDCQDIARLFRFTSQLVNHCSVCDYQKTDDMVEEMYLRVRLPCDMYGRKVSSSMIQRLVENSFQGSHHNTEKSLCPHHPGQGTREVSVLLDSPEFLLVVINRLESRPTDEDDDLPQGVVYYHRNEEVSVPKTVTVHQVDGTTETFNLFAVIQYDGYVVPTTGSSQGHYTANVLKNGQWILADDTKISKLHFKELDSNAYVLGFTKYFV